MVFDTFNVKHKIPYATNVIMDDYGQDWNWGMSFFDTHPEDQVVKHEGKMRFALNQCSQRGSLPVSARSIIEDMRLTFVNNNITLISFYGFGADTDSYPWHKDKMDVFLVQIQGRCALTVEGTEYEETPYDLCKGSSFYIPRGTHHRIQPEASRITWSFGVEGPSDPSEYIS
jgi:mannose-6-phosphate isomerase-like protein (cupin superfamily)